MQHAVEECGHRGGVAEQLAPVLDRPIRREYRGGALVPPHDQLEEILRRGVRQFAHTQIIDDQERHGREIREVFFARPGERRVGEFIEQRVGLAVGDAVPLLNDRVADGLGEMTLAGTRRPEEECVLPLGDEARGRQLEDERAIHLLVEGEVEGVERALGVTEAGLLAPAFEKAILAALEFVAHKCGHEVDGWEVFGLSLSEPRFEDGGHAGEAELPERVIKFDEIHDGSRVRVVVAVRCSMRSR